MSHSTCREGVQETLLKLLEESTIDVLEKDGHKNPRGEYITIDTTNILLFAVAHLLVWKNRCSVYSAVIDWL